MPPRALGFSLSESNNLMYKNIIKCKLNAALNYLFLLLFATLKSSFKPVIFKFVLRSFPHHFPLLLWWSTIARVDLSTYSSHFSPAGAPESR